MNITLLLTASLDRPIGARYLPICAELVQRGHTVRVLALHPDYARCPLRSFTTQGVQVRYVGQMHARKGGSPTARMPAHTLLLTVLRSTLALTCAALATPADVLHLGKPQPINGIAGLIAARLRRLPLYIDCDDDERHGGRFTAAWQRHVFGWFEDHLPPLAAGLTVNTRSLYDRWIARGIPAACIGWVPNGATPEQSRHLPAAKLAGLRAALGLTGQRVIGYAGTLALQNHPVDLLLDAFAQLAATLPNVTLLLIGGGEDLALMQAQVATRGLGARVRFTGHVPRASVRGYLALADISVDPVRDDPVGRARAPLKIMDSLALGVPVVSSAVGDRALLLGGGAGWLTAPGDAAALAATLSAALGDAAALQCAAQTALEVAQRMRWPPLVDAWLGIYQSTINAQARRLSG